jgi:hypothetical protein
MSSLRPARLQRRRTKGWRAPATAVFVGRGTRWGNPFKIGDPGPDGAPMTRADVTTAYALYWSDAPPDALATMRAVLRGRDLLCWCRPDQTCHADFLLMLANG